MPPTMATREPTIYLPATIQRSRASRGVKGSPDSECNSVCLWGKSFTATLLSPLKSAVEGKLLRQAAIKNGNYSTSVD